MKDIFADRNTGYDLRHGNESRLPKVHTTTISIELRLYRNRFWSTLPIIVKQASTIPIFKSHIRYWKGKNCNCRLCKIYIPQVRYISSGEARMKKLVLPLWNERKKHKRGSQKYS